jgi:hypothetical protein
MLTAVEARGPGIESARKCCCVSVVEIEDLGILAILHEVPSQVERVA